MSGFFILLIIFVGIPLLWRWLKPYFLRWSQRRMEDAILRAMGMPPRGSSEAGAGRSRSSRFSGGRSSSGSRRSQHSSGGTGPLIPKEYAVDVEYTEIHSYSEEAVIAPEGNRVRYSVESQVSDAEIIEIRKER